MIDETAHAIEKPATAPGAPRVYALDLVRGLCAIGVAVYHFISWNLGYQIESLGTFGVYTFFVLSGVTMAYVYAKDFRGSISPDAMLRFYSRRIARILPLLAVVAVAAWLFARWQHGVSLSAGFPSMVLTGSGLFSLGPPGFLSNSVGAWSLGIEAIFYALFPVAVLFSQQASLRSLLIFTGALIIGQQLYLVSISDMPDHWHYYISPLTFAPFFALGLLIPRLALPYRRWNLSLAILLLTIVFGYSSVVPVDLYKASGHYVVLIAACAGAVAFAFRSSELPVGLIAPAAFLGEISYSLYLTHWLADFVANRVGGSNVPVKFVVFSTAALALAYVTYRCLEAPASRWLRRRGQA